MKKLLLSLSFLVLCFIGLNAKTTTKQRVAKPNKYYISSSEGNDKNAGSMSAPWKSLTKISATALKAGDSVFFKKNDLFLGHFVVNGSGTKVQPIVITAYGQGEKPIISGQVGAAEGGDYREAILVSNNDNIVFDGLEVQNDRLVNRANVPELIAYGISIDNSSNRVLKNFTLRNVTVKKVYAVKPTLDPADFDNLEVAGIRFFSTRNTADNAKNIQDILIEGCYLTDLQRLGIHFKQGGADKNFVNDSLNRIMNIICRNNTFYYTGGTPILPQRTYNCLIENNIFDHPGATTDPRMPGRGSSVWTFQCFNTIIQYNNCISTRGYFDSYGIHIDHENTNTFVQYNYMEDCEGGFVEILKGNTNAVYRFNVSVNDGWRKGGGPKKAWTNSNHTLWVDNGDNGKPDAKILYCDSTYIYNNTVIIDKPFTTAIAINGNNTYIYNNLFYSLNGAEMGKQQSVVNPKRTGFFMSHNLFFGEVNSEFMKKDALFSSTNNAKDALNKGIAKTGPIVPGAGTGVFKNVPPYPTVDFFGNPIDLSKGSPNIGASKEVLVVSATDEAAFLKDNALLVYPSLASKQITVKIDGYTGKKIKLYDLLKKCVMEVNITAQKGTMVLDVEKLPYGMYEVVMGDKVRRKVVLR